MQRQTLIERILFAVVLAASFNCGGEDSGSDTMTPAGSDLQKRLAACPTVSTSTDPAASACLVGSYSGKTLAGEVCTLVVRGGNAFDFGSPTLSFTYAPVANTILLFDHTVVQGSHQLFWSVSDPIANTVWREVDFKGRFGTYVAQADVKIQIDVTEHRAEGMSSVSCIVPL